MRLEDIKKGDRVERDIFGGIKSGNVIAIMKEPDMRDGGLVRVKYDKPYGTLWEWPSLLRLSSSMKTRERKA